MKKTTTLIPMTTMVNEICEFDNPLLKDGGDLSPQSVKIYLEALLVINRYAQFLSQPLQEWMFVGEDAYFAQRDGGYASYYHISNNRTVEYYTKFEGIELTPKAIEQIYGSIKGTKGKWVPTLHEDGRILVRTSDMNVAQCSGIDVLSTETEEMYNAKLIAAAPELLEALQNLVKVISDGNMLENEYYEEWEEDLKKAVDSAEATIKKATEWKRHLKN